MKQTNDNLREKIKYGLKLSFNKLIDEKRKNGEEFVFMKDGKVIFVDANDVPYREIREKL